jgi:uncharacterized protein YjbI with pentapeptide repeats
MANPEHLAILQQGVEVWNRWRQANNAPTFRPDLSVADLKGARLRGINLRSSDLTRANLGLAVLDEADLSWAKLESTDFNRASLKGANLSEAYLLRTDFGTANLHGAILQKAHVVEASFNGTDLSGADFGHAVVARVAFSNVDLSQTTGMESIFHAKPSSVGFDSIYRSQGKIPEEFLRGAGLPEPFILYVRSLVARPVEFFSCFISYAAEDQEFAECLHEDLQASAVRCWFAPHDVRGGRKLYDQIDEAIRLYDRLLLILSEHSMASEWVNTEIAQARQREVAEQRQMLFPVTLVPFEAIREWRCFDADAGKDSAREIREYFIPDFSKWKDRDSYQQAFQRLLRDLKANTAQ